MLLKFRKKLPFFRKFNLNFETFKILKKFWINQVKNSANFLYNIPKFV